MNKTLLSLLAAAIALPVGAETIELNGKTHEIEELISRTVGPGITYKRIRSNTYPLNINVLMMDVTNPYNKLQTTTANESSQGTESLVKQAARQTTDEMRPIAGANANFWCVNTQEPWSPTLNGICYGGHAKNGEMITETNNHADQWVGGWKQSGIVGITPERTLVAGHYLYKGYVKGTTLPKTRQINQINKVVRDEEIGLYNSFYGKSKKFRPVDQGTDSKGKPCFNDVSGVATEVLCDFAAGESWKIGVPVKMVVKEVRPNAGQGTLGDYTCALVGRGARATELATLKVGDEITIETNYYYQTTDAAGETVNNLIQLDNFVAGNAVVMEGGELTAKNTNDGYCSQVYSRTGYGMSADGKTLYIIVIDKSSDPTYGQSAGCPTRVMCELARHYGCSDMVNFDAGGSAMMYLDGAIINRTTEGTPRAVSNGMLCYSIAPKDDKVARLAFDDITLQAPPYASFTPRIIAYNQYDDVISYDFHGFTLSCDPALGTCDGETFVAGGQATTMPLTATYEGVSITKDMTIVDADLKIRIPNLLIDAAKEYPIEVTASIGANTYDYDPATIDWTIADPNVVTIENGVLRGLAEGSTEVTGKIGSFEDKMNVTVEIASQQYLSLTDKTGWKLANTGVTGSVMDENGTVSFKHGVSRNVSSLKLTKEVPFYSIPDKIWLTFESSLPVTEIVTDIRYVGARTNNATITNEGSSFDSGKEYKVEVPLELLMENPADLANYPLTFNAVTFKFPTDSSLKGQSHTVRLADIEGEYASNTGVEVVASPENGAYASVYPNPVTDGIVTVNASSLINQVAIYSVSGALMGRYPIGDRQATINVGSLQRGIYIVAVQTVNGVNTTRLIVK